MKETERMRRKNSVREHVKQLQGANEPERAGGTKVRVTKDGELKRRWGGGINRLRWRGALGSLRKSKSLKPPKTCLRLPRIHGSESGPVQM